jgi:IMP dehydrogenase
MITWLRSLNYKDLVIIAGNIATTEAAKDLSTWGVDIVKVGIGPGSVCQTRQRTGVGVPQLSALEDVFSELSREDLHTGVIADGGIMQIGDVPKALKWSHGVMIGSLLSGTSETPGDVYRNPQGEYYKVYGGSASGENMEENNFVEGMMKTVPFRGKVKYILREIEHGIRSAFSYVGANNLKEFQEKCEFQEISNGGKQESKL